MLSDLVRECREELVAAAVVHEGALVREQFSEALDDLARALDRGAVEGEVLDAGPGSVTARARIYAALGDGLFDLVQRRGVETSVGELRVVHDWVRAGLASCVEALAREGATIAESEARFRLVFSSAGIVVAELDTDLRFRWVYDLQGQPFFGRSVLGRSVAEFGDAQELAKLTSCVKRVLATGAGERSEFSPTHNGLQRSLLLALEPRRDASGAIVGVIAASTDVTELKHVQNALAQALAYRDQMMAVLAHDLRNPLSTVAALSALLSKKASLQEDVRSALSHIESAATRMDELIETLLDFSAARFGGALPVSPKRTDLHDVTRAVVDELRQPEARVILLEAVGDTEGHWDPDRMAQVISNLVGNALSHGAESEAVRVAIDGREPGVVLAVSNGGPPIPAELLPFLFEPFRRGRAANTAPRGLGLGLYIARQIVTAHGGSIEVASSLDQGTVFTVRLPRGTPAGSADRTGLSGDASAAV